MKKRILFICQHYYPEPFKMHDISKYFIEKGYDVDVVCGIPNYPQGKFYKGYSILKKRKEKYEDVNIFRVFEIPRGKNTNFNIFMNFISFPIFSLLKLPFLLFKKYDKIFMVQLSPVYMSILGIIIGKIKKIETTMWIQDFWPESLFSVLKIKNKILLKILYFSSNFIYKHTDKLVMFTEYGRKTLSKRINKNIDNIEIVHQSCEKIYEDPVFDEEINNKFSKGFNVLYAGAVNPTQNFEVLLQTAKRLQEDDNINDINWIIVGGGMSKDWLQNRVKELGLNNFYFEGFFMDTKDVVKYYTIADVLVSFWVYTEVYKYTIPARVMSYIASGKPLVLSMTGEVKNLVEDAKCGFVSESDNYEEFYKNIKKMYNMPKEDREKLGKNGREYHFKYLERNINFDKLLKFIEK